MTADDKRVIQSIETLDGGRCVDLFVRTDGTYGFEEYRRDVEDARGGFRSVTTQCLCSQTKMTLALRPTAM